MDTHDWDWFHSSTFYPFFHIKIVVPLIKRLKFSMSNSWAPRGGWDSLEHSKVVSEHIATLPREDVDVDNLCSGWEEAKVFWGNHVCPLSFGYPLHMLTVRD